MKAVLKGVSLPSLHSFAFDKSNSLADHLHTQDNRRGSGHEKRLWMLKELDDNLGEK